MDIRRVPLVFVFATAVLYGCGQQQLPADAPAATALASLAVPGRTELHMTLSSPIGSASMVGDRVAGTTTSAVIVGDQVAIPAGSTIQGHVNGIDRTTNRLELAFTQVTTPMGDSASISGSLSRPGRGDATGGMDVVIPAGTDLAITLDQH